MNPRAYQQAALNDIGAELNQADRATAVMACGTGKSLVSLWAAEKQTANTMLVLLPSLALVRQLLATWQSENQWKSASFLAVCSDKSVALNDDVQVDADDFDCKVTTQPHDVKEFLAANNAPKIIFSTYQSAHVVAEGMLVNFNGSKQAFDFAIFDEAHKTAGRDGSQFSFALKDSNLPIKKRLFLTATPRHHVSRDDDSKEDATTFSMDDEAVYGKICHTLSTASAIKQGIIAPYKVIVSAVTSAEVFDKLQIDKKGLERGQVSQIQEMSTQIAVQQAAQKYGAKKIFTFHPSVAAASNFMGEDGLAKLLPTFKTLHVSGAMKTDVRAKLLKEFAEADRAAMSNARCLTEGVDVPAVDMVVFNSPKKSKIDIIQAAGRATRKAEGKAMGYILVPLFIDEQNNESNEEAALRTGFDAILDTLDTLAENDEVMTAIISHARQEKGRTGVLDTSGLNSLIEVIGSGSSTFSVQKLREAILTRAIERIGSDWDEMFGKVKAYWEREGEFPALSDGKLGTWISTNRYHYKNGTLSEERIAKLNGIGFVWEVLDAQWQQSFEELVEYKGKYGEFPSVGAGKLGTWVGTNRKNYKNGTLSEERIAKLNSIGFAWSVDLDAQWQQSFDELSAYHDKYGKFPSVKEGTLGSWIKLQRRSYQNGTLSEERIAKLNSIGFAWSTDLDARWQQSFDELVDYHDKYGKFPSVNDGKLGDWMSRQRRCYKDGTLSEERIAKLNGIGFVWEVLDAQWQQNFDELVDYYDKYGKFPSVKEGKLGGLVSTLRTSYKDGTLSEERTAKLNEIGFVWSVDLDAQWQQNFDELTEYTIKYGKFPAATEGKLGKWISTNRKNYKNGTLSEERIAKLNDVGFVWDELDAQWQQNFEELVEYYDKYGKFPSVGAGKLGVWVANVRGNYKNGKLSPDRIAKLNEIGFVWSVDLDAQWQQNFEELVDYHDKYGKFPSVKEGKLGNWIKVQRRSYQNGTLSNERIAKLNDIGFVLDALERSKNPASEPVSEETQSINEQQSDFNP